MLVFVSNAAVTSLSAGDQLNKLRASYRFLRKSVARSCSSANRSQIFAISKRSVLASLPAGKLFAILSQPCARSRYWFDRFVIAGVRYVR